MFEAPHILDGAQDLSIGILHEQGFTVNTHIVLNTTRWNQGLEIQHIFQEKCDLVFPVIVAGSPPKAGHLENNCITLS